MVQQYTILGRKVGSHYLAMGVLATLFGSTYLAVSGPSKKTVQTPPINASSPDEEDFIKKFLDEADQEAKKAKH